MENSEEGCWSFIDSNKEFEPMGIGLLVRLIKFYKRPVSCQKEISKPNTYAIDTQIYHATLWTKSAKRDSFVL